MTSFSEVQKELRARERRAVLRKAFEEKRRYPKASIYWREFDTRISTLRECIALLSDVDQW